MPEMQQVWKFPLRLNDDGSSDVEMPADARVIHVGVTGRTICLWAIVSPDAEKVVRQFRVVGTGWPMSKVGRHLGSVVITLETTYVWHVFAAWEPQETAA